MRHLILVPHQDDEMLNCYSIMKLFGNECRVAIVFKGGGEPKPNPYSPEELYRIRNYETIEACEKLGVKKIDFLGIPRGTQIGLVAMDIQNYIWSIRYKEIFTCYPNDKHPEHMMLGKIIRNLGVKAVGFITQTDYLVSMRYNTPPDISIRLSDKDYEEKVNLIDIYKTQKHFLPNIVRRLPYRIETFWRIENDTHREIPK